MPAQGQVSPSGVSLLVRRRVCHCLAMNSFEFVASMIQSAAWPTVVVVFVVLLKSQIGDLLGRVKSARAPGGWEAEFERRAGEARDDAQAAVKDLPTSEGGQQSSESSTEPSLVSVPVGEDPTYSVIVAWERLGAAVSSLAIAADIRLRTKVRPGQVSLARSLQESGIVNENFVNSVLELQFLRNIVAHGQRKLSKEEAESYVDAANELIRACSTIRDFKFARPKSSKVSDV